MENLTLNGKQFSAGNVQEIPAHLAESCGSAMAREIEDFLREWWNDSENILLKTSGSTGRPKTIALSKKSVADSADLTVQFFGLCAATNGLLCLPCRYIAGKLMLVRAIRSGMALEVREPSMDVLSTNLPKIHFAALIPSQVNQALLNKFSTKRLAAIPKVLIGGGPIDRDTDTQLRSMSNQFYHSYGMTETATHVALRDISRGAEEYAALPGVNFSLDNRGCLTITANHLPKKIVTNDLVLLSDSLHFKWLGRYDHAIISGGLKFIPEELERKMAPFITENFYVTSKTDPYLGESIVLVVEGKSWNESRLKELKKQLRQILKGYEIPKSMRFVTKFDRTATGKIKRD